MQLLQSYRHQLIQELSTCQEAIDWVTTQRVPLHELFDKNSAFPSYHRESYQQALAALTPEIFCQLPFKYLTLYKMACLARKEAAWGLLQERLHCLFQKHSGLVIAWCKQKKTDEEMRQEALLVLYKALFKYDPASCQAQFSTYLYASLNHLKAKTVALPAPPLSPPPAALDSRLLIRQVFRLTRTLPPLQQAVFLRRYEEHSFAEIGNQLAIPPRQARVLYRTTIKYVASKMG